MLSHGVRYVVSACLAGECCRYDGKSKPDRRILDLVERGLAVAVCPEVLGGLPVPRTPCELQYERAISRTGRDCTTEYRIGAQKALEIARCFGATVAILKARSPSCGCGELYDGSFSKRLVPGNGIFAELARQAGLVLMTEESLPMTCREDL